MPGSAARSAASSLHHHGFSKAHRGETFFVEGTPGPLVTGELARARQWGKELGTRA